MFSSIVLIVNPASKSGRACEIGKLAHAQLKLASPTFMLGYANFNCAWASFPISQALPLFDAGFTISTILLNITILSNLPPS